MIFPDNDYKANLVQNIQVILACWVQFSPEILSTRAMNIN